MRARYASFVEIMPNLFVLGDVTVELNCIIWIPFLFWDSATADVQIRNKIVQFYIPSSYLRSDSESVRSCSCPHDKFCMIDACMSESVLELMV